MAFVNCQMPRCPNKVREGLRRPFYDTTASGKAKADGRLCWKCRDGRRSHLTPTRMERGVKIHDQLEKHYRRRP